MVRKIKVVDVCVGEPETSNEATEQTIETSTEHEPPPPPTTTPPPPPDSEANEVHEDEPTIPEVPAKSKKMLDMPTTKKTMEQVQCQACHRMMSAKTLKYNHAKYCTERMLEDRPEEIPVPQVKLKNQALKTQINLGVKNLKLKKTGKVVVQEFRQAVIPLQTPEMDQSFNYQRAQRISRQSAKYEAMMSNAF
jgi:hypothetical protein